MAREVHKERSPVTADASVPLDERGGGSDVLVIECEQCSGLLHNSAIDIVRAWHVKLPPTKVDLPARVLRNFARYIGCEASASRQPIPLYTHHGDLC
eukprot:COSAG05_NODE_9617_length_611_cov_1.375000_1_plen_96_part_10